MQKVFSPVQQSNLKDAVYGSLRKAILGGEIAAGTHLSEAEIAQALGVSRAPVREALVHLEQDGLVERHPNRGSFVAEISSARDVDELTTLRCKLEEFALTLAAPRVTPEALDRLDELIDRMQAAADQHDLAGLADLDEAFHRTICELAEHRRLFQMWSHLNAQYWALYLTSLQYLGERVEDEIREVGQHHRPIVAALRAKKLDLALLYLQRNIVGGGERLHDWLATRADADTSTGTSTDSDADETACDAKQPYLDGSS